MIPLEVATSAPVTVAPEIDTTSPVTLSFALSPLTMVANIPSVTALAGTSPATT